MSVERSTRWSGAERLIARGLVTLLAANVTGFVYAHEPEPAGAISVASEPAGATVYVDGQAQGTTPLAVKAEPGDHRVRVEKNGFLDNSRVVTVPAGTSRAVQVKLTPDQAPRAAMPVQVETEKPASSGGGGSKKVLWIALGVVAVGAGAALALSGGNKPPTVGTVSASPTTALAGTSVGFSASASDPDNDPLTYSWNFGDGGTGSGATTNHVYTSSGTFNATVSVSDGKKSVTGSTSVTVKTMTGTWIGTVTIPDFGTFAAGFALSQSGSNVSATYQDATGVNASGSGTVSGANRVRVRIADETGQATFDGSVSGDGNTWSGTVIEASGSSFSLTRR